MHAFLRQKHRCDIKHLRQKLAVAQLNGTRQEIAKLQEQVTMAMAGHYADGLM